MEVCTLDYHKNKISLISMKGKMQTNNNFVKATICSTFCQAKLVLYNDGLW